MLIIFYSAIRNPEHDIRPYLFINEQVKKLNNETFTNDTEKRIVQTNIGEIEFHAEIYLSIEKSMVIIINKPTQSGWLFTNLEGGKCFKLFGAGSTSGFLSASRHACDTKQP